MGGVIPVGICQCGCGKATKPYAADRPERGYKRGEYARYLRGHYQRAVGPEYVEDANGCWIWQQHVDPRQGYGRKWDGERVVGAHVVYYRGAHGEVPEGREVHHTCGVRACVNPDHLEALTRREHMLKEGRRPFGNPAAQVRRAAA